MKTSYWTALLSASLALASASGQPVDIQAPPGLVSWWRAEGDASDAVGTNNGLLPSGVSFVPGKVGQAFSFEGSSDGIGVGNTANLQLQDFTIEAWVRRASTALVTSAEGYDAFLFSYGAGGYGFGLNAAGQPFLSRIDFNFLTPSAAITDTNFHHLAVTKSGAEVIFYVDGVAYMAPAYPSSFEFSTPAAIGAAGDTLRNTFLGAIDELSLYSRALTATEIQSIYNAGSAGKSAALDPNGLPGHREQSRPGQIGARSGNNPDGQSTQPESPQSVKRSGASWFVDATHGHDSCDGRSAARNGANGPFATIQKALGHALSGDTVVIAPGIYHESVDLRGRNISFRINGSITLQ